MKAAKCVLIVGAVVLTVVTGIDYLARAYRRHFELPAGWSPYFSGYDEDSYAATLRATLLGDAEPEQRRGDRTAVEGHVAEVPVLPGVVQIGWAIEFARIHLPSSARFRSLAAVKFTRVIQPQTAVTLDLVANAAKRELSFEYRCGDESCLS